MDEKNIVLMPINNKGEYFLYHLKTGKFSYSVRPDSIHVQQGAVIRRIGLMCCSGIACLGEIEEGIRKRTLNIQLEEAFLKWRNKNPQQYNELIERINKGEVPYKEGAKYE